MMPVDVRKKDSEHLLIEWDDGHEGIYHFKTLRKKCPCASCRAIKEQPSEEPLRILSPGEVIADDIQLNEAEIVGRYALQFNWSDGHHEGIYSFTYLRRLCECDACQSG